MEVSRHERRRKRIQLTKYRVLSTGGTAKSEEFREQRLAARNPDIHHFIGMSTRLYVALGDFAHGGRFSGDIVAHVSVESTLNSSLLKEMQKFVRNLKQYLLPRFISTLLPHLEGPSLENFIERQDWSRLVLKKDRIYTHQIMRIKYTTYDTRRDEDIIHLDTAQCNIMLLNPQYSRSTPSQHPFRYGKVIAICHADVGYVGDICRTGSQFTHHRIEFLWVRWYRVHPASTAFRLDQAELMSPDEPGSHNFIDPLQVLRATHMIPCYRLGKRYPEGRGKSEIWKDGSDWERYYVNR